MRFFHLDIVDSTNEEAKRLIRSGALREPAWLVAREQSSGRGSRGRAWSSPRDAGVYLTVVEIPFPVGVGPTTALTLAAGVACAEVIDESVGIDVRLKPVNDLYVGEGKLGGILTEAIIQNGAVEAVITGVGVNVRRADRPVIEGSVVPICIEELVAPEAFARFDIENFVASLVTRIRTWHGHLLTRGPDHIRQVWERYKVPGSLLPDGTIG